MTDTRAVGILDSGFGGLSVALAVRALLPHENLIYAADCGHAPWGDRTDTYIDARMNAMTDFLLSENVKAIVIACNTGTAVSAAGLRAKHSLPIIGIEPALKPAAALSRSRTVGVLATTKTLASAKYHLLRSKMPADLTVIDQPCPGLMDCVEAGAFETPETLALAHRYIDPLTAAGADTLVLGCTHYPFLRKTLSRCVPDGVQLLDPAPAVAQQLLSRLAETKTLRETGTGTERFYATDTNSAREKVLQTLWGADAQLQPL